MVKKRPRTRSRHPLKKTQLRSKMDANYWRDRLFRNTFTYNDQCFQVNHWSVKIQQQGIRKTFSLRAGDPAKAAVEACRLYRTIVSRGWESVSSPDRSNKVQSVSAPANQERK